MLSTDISAYNQKLSPDEQAICAVLCDVIDKNLKDATNKLWHGHPVWFIDENPITGFSKEKRGIRLMFWSGVDFDEPGLNVLGKKFRDASIFFTSVDEINVDDLKRWLKKSMEIQWDYKNIVKRKGELIRIK